MTAFLPVAVASAVVCVDLWVLSDAQRLARQGTPVVVRFGPCTIATPQAWAVACLVVFVIFVPVYAVARRRTT